MFDFTQPAHFSCLEISLFTDDDYLRNKHALIQVNLSTLIFLLLTFHRVNKLRKDFVYIQQPREDTCEDKFRTRNRRLIHLKMYTIV